MNKQTNIASKKQIENMKSDHRSSSSSIKTMKKSFSFLFIILILMQIILQSNNLVDSKLAKIKMMKKLLKAKLFIKPLIKSGAIRAPMLHLVMPMMMSSAMKSWSQAATAGIMAASGNDNGGGGISSVIGGNGFANIGSTGIGGDLRNKFMSNLPKMPFLRGKENVAVGAKSSSGGGNGGGGGENQAQYIIDMNQFSKNMANLPEMYGRFFKNLVTQNAQNGDDKIDQDDGNTAKLQQLLNNCLQQQQQKQSTNIFRKYMTKQQQQQHSNYNRCVYPQSSITISYVLFELTKKFYPK